MVSGSQSQERHMVHVTEATRDQRSRKTLPFPSSCLPNSQQLSPVGHGQPVPLVVVVVQSPSRVQLFVTP